MAAENNSTESTVVNSEQAQLYNWQIAPAIQAVIENQFDPAIVKDWSDAAREEVATDAFNQLTEQGMIKPTASLYAVLGEMQSWHTDFKLLHRCAKVGLVNLGMPVSKYMKWDELVRQYYLGNNKQAVHIQTFTDGFAESVWNGIPETAHKMTVLGEQAAAMSND
jgi:hypothetical protein